MDKKNWLVEHFARPVKTEWISAEEYTSTINLEISNGIIQSGISARGATVEESISNLFAQIVNHGPRNHIVYTYGDLRRVSINPHTLEITPLAA